MQLSYHPLAQLAIMSSSSPARPSRSGSSSSRQEKEFKLEHLRPLSRLCCRQERVDVRSSDEFFLVYAKLRNVGEAKVEWDVGVVLRKTGGGPHGCWHRVYNLDKLKSLFIVSSSIRLLGLRRGDGRKVRGKSDTHGAGSFNGF